MFEFNIFISRYIFFILSVVFIIQGIVYILARKKAINPNAANEASLSQRFVIVITHIAAFTILCFDADNLTLKLFIAVVSFALFLAAFVFTGVFFKNGCRLIINSVVYLCDLSLIILTRLNPALARRQLFMLIIGFAACAAVLFALKFVLKTDKASLFYLVLGGLLIISPIFIGVTKGGAQNWVRLSVSSYSIEFQPSEGAKFFFVFYLAGVFCKERKFSELLAPITASMCFILVLVYQRDLGGALIFFISFMVMLYIATNNLPLISLGFLTFAGACAVAYRMFSHIRVRVAAWLNPFDDITNTGWQITQALFAIGTWGPFGSGLTRGSPLSIPMAENDFVFSSIAEELGVLFALCLIGVYIFIFYMGFGFAINAKDRFNSMLAAGFTSMLAFQTFLIIGGDTRLIPLTGVTLPFVSQGGSSVIMSLLMAGVILWVGARNEGAVK